MATQSQESPQKVLWRHPRPEQTAIYRFKCGIEKRWKVQIKNYQELYAWSIHNRIEFWNLCFKTFPLIHSGQPTQILEQHERMDSIPRWFQGVYLNFAENILYTSLQGSPSQRSTQHKEDDKVAIVEVREAQTTKRSMTWGGLRDRVAVFAAALRASGVATGDRVAVVMSNCIDTLCIFMATTSLGAMFSSSSTDMGAKGILERLRQIEPRLVFVEDSALYNGKHTDLRPKMQEIEAGMQGIRNFKGIVSVPWGDAANAHSVHDMNQTISLQAFLEPHQDQTAQNLTFNRLPFHAGFLIVYSSGTTGTPKCIVHSAGGFLLAKYREYKLNKDITPESIVQQFTTTGWIAYLATVSTMLFGARLVIYDGSPFRPSPDAFLRLAGEQRTTHLGISPPWIQALRTAGVVPRNVPGTQHIQLVTSTGSVLPADAFHWFYSAVGFHPHTQIGNISGGTDIAGTFGDCNPLDPVVASGGCQCWALGLDVRVYDTSTNPSSDGGPAPGREVPAGVTGELVCTSAFPNMPVGFWGDDAQRTRYRAAYFARFDDVWVQGDLVQVEPLTRSIRFLGRADGVLNPRGVRFGSAEVYSVLDGQFSDLIEDSVCVGQRRPGDADEQVLLFVKMRPGHAMAPKLVTDIKGAIAQALSKRHVPRFVFETPAIPVTVNGKKVELPIKRIVSGETITPSGTLANPDALTFYYDFVRSESKARALQGKL